MDSNDGLSLQWENGKAQVQAHFSGAVFGEIHPHPKAPLPEFWAFFLGSVLMGFAALRRSPRRGCERAGELFREG